MWLGAFEGGLCRCGDSETPRITTWRFCMWQHSLHRGFSSFPPSAVVLALKALKHATRQGEDDSSRVELWGTCWKVKSCVWCRPTLMCDVGQRYALRNPSFTYGEPRRFNEVRYSES
jgi:hypothetical protein